MINPTAVILIKTASIKTAPASIKTVNSVPLMMTSWATKISMITLTKT